MIVVIASVIVLVTGGLITWWVVAGGDDSIENAPVLEVVKRGPFIHTVLEDGEVESSNNVELKCEVKSRNTGGTEIVWVIEEGAIVKEGDEVCKFDDSALVRERDQQGIICNTSKALVAQADAALIAARKGFEEYDKGIYVQEKKTIEGEIDVAKENLRRAELKKKSSERLLIRGLIDRLQYQADVFAVQKATKDVEIAEGKLTLLEITASKMRTTLQGDIEAADVKYNNEMASHNLDLNTLADLNAQIEKCTLRAPKAGQIVHANQYSSRGGSAEFVVEQGAKVPEGRTVIRIPDPEQMQVRSTINESRVTFVKEGMPVKVRIEAIPDSQYEGVVTRVNKYAEPSGWTSQTVKEYRTVVKILNPPQEIRSGMTAEVRIFVDQRPDALQIPVQAVCEQKGQAYVLLKKGDSYETLEIKIGASNETDVAIESSELEAGDQIVLNPRTHPDKLKLPVLKEGEDMPQVETFAAAEQPVSSPADQGGPGGRASEGRASEGRGGGESGRGGGGPSQMISRFDSDGDGQLSTDELAAAPERLRDRLAGADADGDGFLTSDEIQSALSAAGGGPGGGPPAGGGGGE